MQRLIISIVCGLLLPVGVFAQQFNAESYGGLATMPSVRDLGSGEAFTVVPEEDNVLYNNPAGLNFVKVKVNLPELIYIFNNSFFKTLQYIVDNQENLALVQDMSDSSLNSPENQAIMDDLTSSMAGIENRWVRMGFSPNISATFKNFGFGVYDRLELDFRLNYLYFPTISAKATNDIVITGGMAMRLMDKIAVGANVRFINRRTSGVVKLNVSDVENSQGIMADLMDKVALGSNTIAVTPGAILPLLENKLKVGLVLQDIVLLPLSGDDEVELEYTPNIKVGASFKLPLKEQTYFIRHIKVGASLDDALNLEREGKNYILNTHVGAEMKLLPAFLRVGLNGGLPSVGVGIDLWAIRADYVFFGKERGNFPGQDPAWNHMFSMRLGW